MTFKLSLKLSIILLLIFALKSCGIYRKVDAKDYPPEPEKRVAKNIEEGRGFGSLGKKKNNGTFDFATSNELWRATLDTLDFMPLLAVDYGGGLIITDWYGQDGNLDESIKISIRFLTNEIRSDALSIKIFKKQCTTDKNCTINEENSSLNDDLTLAILKKATIYKKGSNKGPVKGRNAESLRIFER